MSLIFLNSEGELICNFSRLATFLTLTFLVSVFKLGVWIFPFSYVVRKREEEEKITQSSNALQYAFWVSRHSE